MKHFKIVVLAIVLCVFALNVNAKQQHVPEVIPEYTNVKLVFDGNFPMKKRVLIQRFHNLIGPKLEELTGVVPNCSFTMYPDTSKGIIGWDHSMNNLYTPYNVSNDPTFYWFYTIELAHHYVPDWWGIEEDYMEGVSNQSIFRAHEYISHALGCILINETDFKEYDPIRENYIGLYELGSNKDFGDAISSLKSTTVYQIWTNYQMNALSCDVGMLLYMTLYQHDSNFFKTLFANWNNVEWEGLDGYVQLLANSVTVPNELDEFEYIDGVEKHQWINSRPEFKIFEDTRNVGIDVVTVAPTSDYARYGLTDHNPMFFTVVGHSNKHVYDNSVRVYDRKPDYEVFQNIVVPVKVTTVDGQIIRNDYAQIMPTIDGWYRMLPWQLPAGEYVIEVGEQGSDLYDRVNFTIDDESSWMERYYAAQTGKKNRKH